MCRWTKNIRRFRLTHMVNPIRDYINVVDLAEAHGLALGYLKNGTSDVFNLGTGRGNSVLEIVEAVKKETGADFAVGQTQPRLGEYAEMRADNRKAKEILGWVPKRTIADSVKSLVTWYRLHPNGW